MSCNLIETLVKLVVFFAYIKMSVDKLGLGKLLHNLPPDIKKSVRHFEKCNLKLTREMCRVLYNKTCLQEYTGA